MKGTLLAHVRRVSTSPEGRALVHAVGDAGLEVKIEVPVEAVRGVSGDHVLMLAWSLHPLPLAPQPQAASTSPATTEATGEPMAPATAGPAAPAADPARPSPSAVDQQFMALMSRAASSAAAPTTPATSPGEGPTARPEHPLAALLGIGRPPT